jgi:hypothetical protein
MYVSPKESFLEDLSFIINAGKIIELFENEELDSVAMRIRSVAEQSGYMDNRQSLLSFFQKVFFCGSALSNCHVKLKTDHIYNFHFIIYDFQVGYNFFSSLDEFLKLK